MFQKFRNVDVCGIGQRLYKFRNVCADRNFYARFRLEFADADKELRKSVKVSQVFAGERGGEFVNHVFDINRIIRG